MTIKQLLRLVYVGVTGGGDGRVLHVYFEVRDDQLVRKELYFDMPVHGQGRPGEVFEFECDPKDRSAIVAGTGSLVGQWEDPEVKTWQLLSDTHIQVAAARASNVGNDPNYDALEPFRRAYRHLESQHDRANLIARMVHYVTGRT